MSKINIWEVGPRDGLQNENRKLSAATRVQLVKRLAQAGAQKIEIGAFVSPKWVPQMANSNQVIKSLMGAQKKRTLKKGLQMSALVPNSRGMEDAILSGVREIAIFGACSETFSKKNINCSISESFKRFEYVIAEAQKNKIKVRGYLSTVFGCPYEGKVSQAKVLRLTKKLLDMGCYEVSLGDTIGVATPKPVRELLAKLKTKRLTKKIAMHFHDTRGTALANVLASLDFGITTFDSSVGGMGGCPYAKGASGNLATEDLVYLLHGMGYKTGMDIKKLIKITHWMEKELKRPLPSHLSKT